MMWLHQRNGFGLLSRYGRQAATAGRSTFLWVAISAVALAWAGPVPGQAAVSAHAKQCAEQLRQKYPFHLQALALSSPDQGKRVLIIAEPPPHAVRERLEALDPEVFGQAFIREQPIGHGGFVKDVVVELPVERYGTAHLHEFLGKLGRLLYSTSYKLPVIDLDHLDRQAERAAHLDLSVSASELQQWFLGGPGKAPPALPLYPLGGRRPVLALQVFQAAPRISFVATTVPPRPEAARAGLILWWVHAGKDLGLWQVEARQFTLEADLLLGALVDKAKGVLIVGRARQATFDQLPPLRVETLLLLSRVSEASLAQSYERNHPLVYGLPDGRDWAPIYLSKELVDTEYGSLLNITDQLLKRWSNNGQVDYERFNYPDPKKYAFEEPLGRTVILRKHFSSLTFNWNTKGVGYTVQGGGPGVFALTRTGSLPVSYIPESGAPAPGSGPAGVVREMRTYEEKGHDFFAGQNDPNLVRVTQYLGFYQIFYQLGLYRYRSAPPQQLDYPEAMKEELTRDYLTRLRNADRSVLKELLDRALDNEARHMRAKDLSADDQRKLAAALTRAKKATDAAAETIKAGLGSATESEVGFAGRYFANPRGAGHAPDLGAMLFVASAEGAMRAVAVDQDFPAELTARAAKRARGWIHTPVVVFSRIKGPIARLRGGHNLDAAISRVEVRVDPGLGKDQIKVERGEGGVLILRVSTRDRPVPNEVVRLAARGETDAARLNAVYRNSREVRTPEVALDVDLIGNGPPQPPIVRGFKGDDLPRGWWERSSAKLPEYAAEHNRQRIPGDGVTIYLSRSDDTGAISLWKVDHRAGDAVRQFQTGSPLDAADAITAALKTDLVYAALEPNHPDPSGTIRLIFGKGFTPEEAEGLADTSRLRIGTRLDERLAEHVKARWYETPADTARLEAALKLSLDAKTPVRVSEPTKVKQGPAGELSTSFEVRGAVRAAADKVSPFVAETTVRSEAGAERGRFSQTVRAAIDRLQGWALRLRGEPRLRDVLDDLDNELRAIENEERAEGKGQTRFKVVPVRLEAGRIGIVLHITITGESKRAG